MGIGEFRILLYYHLECELKQYYFYCYFTVKEIEG